MNVIVDQSFWIGSMDFLQEVWNGDGQRHAWMETLLDDIENEERADAYVIQAEGGFLSPDRQKR